MKKARVVLVGATGAVGRVFLEVLEEGWFPLKALRLCASSRSIGKRMHFSGGEVEVEEVTAMEESWGGVEEAGD